MKIYRKTLVVTVSLMILSFAAHAVEINVTPGSLEATLRQQGIPSDGILSLKGHADVRDLMHMSDLPSDVSLIDMTDLAIDEYSAQQPVFEDRSYFSANTLPCYIFFKSRAAEVRLPRTLLSIDNGAFAGAEVRKVVLNEGLREIGDHVFYDCTSLRDINIPASLSKLGIWAFARCSSLPYLDMSKCSVANLGERTFTGCSSMKRVQLPESLVSISKEAFSGTAITSLDLNGVRHADDYALVGMAHLQEVSLRHDASLGNGVLMANTSLNKIIGLPVDLPGLFVANCSNLDLSSDFGTLVSAGDYSLAGINIGNVTLGSELTYIGSGAFRNVSGLKTVNAVSLDSRIPATAENAFEGIGCGNVILIVKDGTSDVWKADPIWSRFNVMDESSTGVHTPIENTSAYIAAACHNGILRVSAYEPLTRVEVYNADGRCLMSENPGLSVWQAEPGHDAGQVLIIKAVTATQEKTFKLAFK